MTIARTASGHEPSAGCYDTRSAHSPAVVGEAKDVPLAV
jgi:hypothetical protein